MCIEPTKLSRRRVLTMTVAATLASLVSRSSNAFASSPLSGRVSINPRDAWGSDLPPTGPLVPEPDVRILIVHHTAGPTNYTVDDVPEQIRAVYRYHTGPDKRWSDPCYNFFVDRFGGAWEGRAGSVDGPVMPDATGGNQGFSQLVCLLGNFHESSPTAEMLETLEQLLAWLAVRYGLNTEVGATATFVSRGSNKWPAGSEVTGRVISGHRDMSLTVCPGDFVYPLLETEIPERVNALVRADAPTTAGTDPVVSIPVNDVSSAPPPSTEVADSAKSSTTNDLPESEPPESDAASTTVTGSEGAATISSAPSTAANTTTTAPRPASLPPPSDDGGGNEIPVVAVVAVGSVALSAAALVAARRVKDNTDEPNADVTRHGEAG